jgi:hypothetical protein
MVCFTCISVRSLVGRRLWTRTALHIQLSAWGWNHEVRNLDSPTHHGAHTDARTTYHTAYTTVSLRMNPRGSKHVADIRNEILVYKIMHLFGLCCVILSQCTVKNNIKCITTCFGQLDRIQIIQKIYEFFLGGGLIATLSFIKKKWNLIFVVV